MQILNTDHLFRCFFLKIFGPRCIICFLELRLTFRLFNLAFLCNLAYNIILLVQWHFEVSRSAAIAKISGTLLLQQPFFLL